MADPHLQIDQQSRPPVHTPLLPPTHNNTDNHHDGRRQDQETDLDQALEGLETFLTLLGFNQSSVLSFLLSWTVFILIGVSLPVMILELSKCGGCEKYQIKDFELDIVASQACLAAVSLACLSHSLRKYGIRKFLFLDRRSGPIMARFGHKYVQQMKDSLRLLILWSLPCFILKVVREVIRVLYVQHESWWLSAAILFGLILSWGYFCVVTASQIVTLFQTTGYSGIITVINGGDFAVSSIVQVVGISICLHAATKISHRAQGIASIVSRWHALATCISSDASHQMRVSNSTGNLEAANQLNSLHLSYSESDLESVDYIAMPTNTQLASNMSSYHRRLAFVLYLQNNPGGITIFGWTVDRALINTIFFIELTLVTFVLGKTIVFTSK
ncbi:uncharacterized protein LOC110631696 isoform X2 [Hevea brasiliensis]|uniref:uncharacterized protein LOC110631696 isoform X2 n=1 Tax=Hevea brasiliensis TaxID=3981 RepID=UPI0025F69F09|nr:uncharacterized protein LOC110631696 isoform X2 [Hevea brasiliensis]